MGPCDVKSSRRQFLEHTMPRPRFDHVIHALHLNFLILSSFFHAAFGDVGICFGDPVVMTKTALGLLTLPAVVALIAFLSYGSQLSFHYLEPHPLEVRQKIIFNILIICIWISYFRACFVDPGRVPQSLNENSIPLKSGLTTQIQPRWCRKCNAYKTPRAHHCKTCSRFVVQVQLEELTTL